MTPTQAMQAEHVLIHKVVPYIKVSVSSVSELCLNVAGPVCSPPSLPEPCLVSAVTRAVT